MRLTLTKDGDIGTPLAETNIPDHPTDSESADGLAEITTQAEASFAAMEAADKALADKLAGESV